MSSFWRKFSFASANICLSNWSRFGHIRTMLYTNVLFKTLFCRCMMLAEITVKSRTTFYLSMFHIYMSSKYTVSPRFKITLDTLIKVALMILDDMTIQVFYSETIKITKGTHESFASSMKSQIVNSWKVCTE